MLFEYTYILQRITPVLNFFFLLYTLFLYTHALSTTSITVLQGVFEAWTVGKLYVPK